MMRRTNFSVSATYPDLASDVHICIFIDQKHEPICTQVEYRFPENNLL